MGLWILCFIKHSCRLLSDENERLSNIESIKAHPFFKGVDWVNMRNKTAAIIPVLSGPLDTSYFDCFEQEMDDEVDIPKYNMGQLALDTNPDNQSPCAHMLDRRYTMDDIHFVGYTFRSFDVVNFSSTSPLNSKTRPKSTHF